MNDNDNPIENTTVLVVDNDGEMRRLVARLLTSLGVGRVLQAPDGEAAKQRLLEPESDRPDVVITELDMTPMDGVQLLTWIRHDDGSPNPLIPVILLTARSDPNLIFQMRDLGVKEILARPMTTNSLERRLRAALEHPRRFIDATDYREPDRRRRESSDGGRDQRGRRVHADR